MTRVVVALVLVLMLALGGALWGLWTQRAAAVQYRAERDELQRKLTQERISQAIVAGMLDREEARSAELAETLRKIHGGPDAKLPEHIRRLLDPGGL